MTDRKQCRNIAKSALHSQSCRMPVIRVLSVTCHTRYQKKQLCSARVRLKINRISHFNIAQITYESHYANGTNNELRHEVHTAVTAKNGGLMNKNNFLGRGRGRGIINWIKFFRIVSRLELASSHFRILLLCPLFHENSIPPTQNSLTIPTTQFVSSALNTSLQAPPALNS